MAEVNPQGGTQLDRIEANVAQILDRLTRMEERQNSLSARQEAHNDQLTDHQRRIHSLEVSHAVAKEAAKGTTANLQDRWSAAGKIALVALGGALTFLSGIAVRVWGP